jgi:hypothetical protein
MFVSYEYFFNYTLADVFISDLLQGLITIFANHPAFAVPAHGATAQFT